MTSFICTTSYLFKDKLASYISSSICTNALVALSPEIQLLPMDFGCFRARSESCARLSAIHVSERRHNPGHIALLASVAWPFIPGGGGSQEPALIIVTNFLKVYRATLGAYFDLYKGLLLFACMCMTGIDATYIRHVPSCRDQPLFLFPQT